VNRASVAIMKCFGELGTLPEGSVTRTDLLRAFCRIHPKPSAFDSGIQQPIYMTFIYTNDDEDGPYSLTQEGYDAVPAFE
jgi:hypothetical protein